MLLYMRYAGSGHRAANVRHGTEWCDTLCIRCIHVLWETIEATRDKRCAILWIVGSVRDTIYHRICMCDGVADTITECRRVSADDRCDNAATILDTTGIESNYCI